MELLLVSLMLAVSLAALCVALIMFKNEKSVHGKTHSRLLAALETEKRNIEQISNLTIANKKLRERIEELRYLERYEIHLSEEGVIEKVTQAFDPYFKTISSIFFAEQDEALSLEMDVVAQLDDAKMINEALTNVWRGLFYLQRYEFSNINILVRAASFDVYGRPLRKRILLLCFDKVTRFKVRWEQITPDELYNVANIKWKMGAGRFPEGIYQGRASDEE